jgi:hypothetical protein
MKEQELKIFKRFNSLLIEHPQFDTAVSKIINAYKFKSEAERPVNLICIGMSGTGKSTLKKHVIKKYPSFASKDRKIIPVLEVNTPALPTVKNVAEAMLLQLGDPLFHRGSTSEKTNRILHYIRECEVKLIIFDELQHFVDQGNKSAPRQVSDWLKTVIDDSEVSTVFMGLEQSEHILKINEQLRRRFTHRVDLKPFSICCSQSFKDFTSVLKTLHRAVEMPLVGRINSDHFRRWHFATNGVIAHMITLTLSAFQISQREGYASIHQRCLEQAFVESIWAQGSGKLNPFNNKFEFQRLIKPGMPFHTAGSKELAA